jgi:hypothetical protein
MSLSRLARRELALSSSALMLRAKRRTNRLHGHNHNDACGKSARRTSSATAFPQDHTSTVAHESQCVLKQPQQLPRIGRVLAISLKLLDAGILINDALLGLGYLPVGFRQVCRVVLLL